MTPGSSRSLVLVLSRTTSQPFPLSPALRSSDPARYRIAKSYIMPHKYNVQDPISSQNVQNPISSQNVLQATVTGFRFSPTARRPETPGFGGTGPDGSIFPPRLVIAIYIFYQYVCEMSYSELFNPCPTLLLKRQVEQLLLLGFYGAFDWSPLWQHLILAKERS